MVSSSARIFLRSARNSWLSAVDTPADPHAVDVILLQPVKRTRQQKVLHLVATEVEDQRAPVAVLALARVGMLIQMGAVEVAQPMLCLLYTSPSPRDRTRYRMPSSA